MELTQKEQELFFQNKKTFFKGKIEENYDPLQQGRYKVRVLGVHPPESLAPVTTLPWAVTISPLVFGFDKGNGISSIARKNTWVWLFFDNNDINHPVIIGAYTGGEDLNSKMSKEDKEGYLKNHVIHTEAGHFIEVDDRGRIHIHHNSGTNILINKEGELIINTVNNVNVDISGNTTITTSGETTIKSSGNTKIQGVNVYLN